MGKRKRCELETNGQRTQIVNCNVSDSEKRPLDNEIHFGGICNPSTTRTEASGARKPTEIKGSGKEKRVCFPLIVVQTSVRLVKIQRDLHSSRCGLWIRTRSVKLSAGLGGSGRGKRRLSTYASRGSERTALEPITTAGRGFFSSIVLHCPNKRNIS